ncbi:DUF1471 domain-containing protein [Hafnia alvei]|uniref:DUF1471 domain-containing protein n=1 Tax=Hafnia alvei TaxID=569 RepID=UPI000622A187|nr:DUF1471 domain-containing protein [Hafnia alvei]KKI41543.1 hypothetical protein XK86_20100 [Hafnia alvei]
MKLLKSVIVISSLISFSALSAQEISREEASKYTKSGSFSLTENGFTMNDNELSKMVDEKGGIFYVIISKQGEQNHKTINVEIYK